MRGTFVFDVFSYDLSLAIERFMIMNLNFVSENRNFEISTIIDMSHTGNLIAVH